MHTLRKKIQHREHREATEDTEGERHSSIWRDAYSISQLSLCNFLLVSVLLAEIPAAAQGKPLMAIDQECTAFAMAADGRVVYAVRRTITKNKFQMERDDIWIAEPGGRRRRIVEGEKLVRGTGPFSYQVHALHWSPDGRRVVADLETKSMSDEEGSTQDVEMGLLLDENGKEIKISGADSMISGAVNAEWLGDGATVGFLKEEIKPALLFSLNTVNPATGRTARIFENTGYAAVAWLTKRNLAAAVERDAQLSRPAVLVLLDIVKQTRKELARLETFSGGLSISPSGEKIAYYKDLETLEVIEVPHPEKARQVHALVGAYRWTPDERRILLKPGAENKSNVLELVNIENGNAEPILHGLTYRDFEISPDGRQVAVRIPGKGNIEVYPLR